MTLPTHVFRSAGVLLLLSVTTPLAAKDLTDLSEEPARVYFGANFGRARTQYDNNFLDTQLNDEAIAAGDTLEVTDHAIDRMSDVWWGNVGYLFTPYTAVEASYLHLGEVRYQLSGNLAVNGSSLAAYEASELTSRGPAIALYVRIPFTESFDIGFRVGDYIAKSVLHTTLVAGANTLPLSSSKTQSSLLLGAGATYNFLGHWSLHADFLRVNEAGDRGVTGKYSVNAVTGGVSFTF